ncbi:MAG: hypothetical protein KKD17_02760 [Nanoarchaeota archaeon]|nr:hypothetical protein [Nanoarchaeota archaeon]
MLPSKEVINYLLELGLNNYEAKVYLTLVEEGTSTAKNVSDITGIPYGKVYEIITSLCTKGFSMTLPTKPMKCKALSPQEILNTTKEKALEKFSNLENVFNEELVPLYMQSKQLKEPKGIMWIVNGRANINKKVETMIKGGKRSICIYLSENGLKRLAFQKNVLKEAFDRGVSIRIISKMTKENEEDCGLLSFCDIHNSKLPITNCFVSIDKEESIVIDPVPDDDNVVRGRDIGMWITSKAFTGFLESVILSQLNGAKKNGGNEKSTAKAAVQEQKT